MNSNYTEFV